MPDRRLEIGVGQNDRGRLAAQLQSHTRDPVRRRRGDQCADARRARKGHKVDPAVRGQGRANVALRGQGRANVAVRGQGRANVALRGERRPRAGSRAGDEVDDACRQIGRRHRVGEQEGVEWSVRAGLEHDGAARRQGRRELGQDLVERIVPWRDRGHDADRLTPHLRASNVLDLVTAVGQLYIGLQNLDREAGLHLQRVVPGGTHLGRDDPGQVRLPGPERLRQPGQRPSPRSRAGVAAHASKAAAAARTAAFTSSRSPSGTRPQTPSVAGSTTSTVPLPDGTSQAPPM